MSTQLFPDIVVNGETVPFTAVAAETQNHPGPRDKPGTSWRKAADAIAIRTLLLQEARRRGLSPEPEEVGPNRFETEEEALIRTLLDDAVEVEKPTDEAVRAEWARDPSRFRAPPLWEVSHILCACDPEDVVASAAAQARIAHLAERVAADPACFADIAANESDCGSRANGGFLGQLRPGDTVPEFEDVLRSLAEGEVTSGPVQTRFGYHLIRMDALAEGQVLPFETVKDKIAAAMEKATWARAAKDFVAALVEEADISGARFGKR
ncbi:peptidase [Rhodospirillaceae bacterium KN72]|uniref:Parvulin-like PPIase n=1 Tax=Pacificispira spongiicola TaxID=2729598 RepID=A0A7Y0DWZ1_9PROT|nr:peptidylprolyl isomerase [Pacificispira spongiicola]NMM43091.1 peptidase [Pacificispira spongiicola]